MTERDVRDHIGRLIARHWDGLNDTGRSMLVLSLASKIEDVKVLEGRGHV